VKPTPRIFAFAFAALLSLPGCGADPETVSDGPEPSRPRSPRRSGEAPPYLREIPAPKPQTDDEDERRRAAPVAPPAGSPRGPIDPGHVNPLERPTRTS
jgi:hypothetical protein